MRCIPILASLLLSACTESPPETDVCGGLTLDADGDGICDGADACPLDAENDADGDGICAADDPCPLDAADDTDGDGVCDSEDPCPADAPDDTDGDGVCDSDDACPGGDDTVDTDDDGVADACDPCPGDPAVTEGEGPCAGDTGDTDTGDTGAPPCSYVDVPLGAALQAPGVFTPEYLGVSMKGIVSQSGFEDFVDDGADETAWLEFSFYDASFSYQCAVRYDLSLPGAAMPSNAPWTQAAPVALWEAWDLFPSHGETNCAQVSHPSFPGHVDPRSLLESIQWAMALGPMHDLDDHMQADPAYAPYWASDYEPYVASMYVGYDGHAPIEANYFFGYERTCDTLDQDPVSGHRVTAPRPAGGPLGDYYEGHIYYLLPL